MYSPSTVQAYTDLHTVRQKDLKAMKSFYIQDPASVPQCFFYCLTLSHFTIFFFNNLHWFFLYVDSFLPFLQKQWKDCNVNVSRRQLAWLINIHSCRPNNPLVTTSSVSDLIISNVHVKDWEEKCSELNYLLNYSQKLSI